MVKLSALLPNYFVKEINWLYTIFIINSFCTFWMSHILHMRGCIIQQKSGHYARFIVALFCIRIAFLIIIVLATPFVNFWLAKFFNYDLLHHSITVDLRCDG